MAATEVLVVVDPTVPGSAPVAEVARRSVIDGGRLVATVEQPSVTATVDVVVAALRHQDDAPLALVDAALVTVPTVYGDVIAEPDAGGRILRLDGGEVAALRVPAAARSDLADALSRTVATWPRERVLDVVATALDDLAGAGHEIGPGAFPARLALTPDDAASALAAADAVDEPALRLRRASRSDDGFLSTFLVRPLSRRLTRRAVALDARPAQVTAVALALGLLAALAYSGGGRGWLVLGSLLLLASLVVDCVDGEVARYTRTTSPLGGWLDVGADRVKEYAVYGALAAGAATRAAWLLALASLALLVTRHFVDFGFAARRARATAAVEDGAVGRWSAGTDRRSAVRYAKRAVIAPVGERTIVLAVLAPLVGVRWTFVVLLVMGVVAAAWTTAGRVGRALAWTAPLGQPARRLLQTQVDGSPVPRTWWPLATRFGWLLPALARALEQGGTVLLLAWLAPSALPGAFVWLAVVAIGEYDLTYRGRLTGTADAAGPLAVAGWPLRLVGVLVLALLVPTQALGRALAVAGAVLAVAVIASSAAFWRRSLPSSP
ncbi:DUF5941 domain-containing protein [Angustibacter sp. Root456]|uniref:DUF5941 domain-containing protein n=1 Tax=Angustibacter sp. Root456 TaxID=1736539 RepID=UPI00138F259A|nr:DUF5941 domain-containing protein [Angustibacter sp. Root456]